MGYELVKIGFAKNERVFSALNRLGFSMKKAQNLCDKGRILDSSARTLAKNQLFSGELFMTHYVCYPKGLKPVFETDDFAVFEKPSGICSHPNGRNSPYNMYDEIWHLYGKGACVAHRLDAETSGLLLVAKNTKIATELKSLFENRAVFKSYLAYVRGDFSADLGRVIERGLLKPFNASMLNLAKYCDFKAKSEYLKGFHGYVIDKAMKLGGLATSLKQKMIISGDGKRALTLIRVLKNPNDLNQNASLLECVPLTGRQHQIRVHLFHVEHAILGEMLYGLSRAQAESILDKQISVDERIKLTGANRLMLHANELKFSYKGEQFNIKSQAKFAL